MKEALLINPKPVSQFPNDPSRLLQRNFGSQAKKKPMSLPKSGVASAFSALD
jgi:hypothetical protein